MSEVMRTYRAVRRRHSRMPRSHGPQWRGMLLPMAKPAIDVRQLSRDERLDLIEQLWDSLSDDERNALPLTTEQERELDRRLDVLDREGPSRISGDELRARLRRQSS
jgi:putative addiction module component (TIGR02574 family)